jgi:hypothetical protein
MLRLSLMHAPRIGNVPASAATGRSDTPRYIEFPDGATLEACPPRGGQTVSVAQTLPTRTELVLRPLYVISGSAGLVIGRIEWFRRVCLLR